MMVSPYYRTVGICFAVCSLGNIKQTYVASTFIQRVRMDEYLWILAVSKNLEALKLVR